MTRLCGATLKSTAVCDSSGAKWLLPKLKRRRYSPHPALSQGERGEELLHPNLNCRQYSLTPGPSPKGRGENVVEPIPDEEPMRAVVLRSGSPSSWRRRTSSGANSSAVVYRGLSIALVINLWSMLSEIEFFPFLILAAITSAVLAAGSYTLHHWKLESTSRGLLLIGMLLVPLDFAVLAGLPHKAGAWWLHYAARHRGVWPVRLDGAARARI